jgi:hypothetical protein
MMRNLALLGAVVSLTLVAATSAQATGPATPGAAATTLCSKLQAAIGADTFGALVGSSDACAAKLVTAYNVCSDAGAPGTAAFRKCAEAEAVATVKQLLNSGKLPQLQAAVGKLTQSVCTALQAKNGTTFTKVFADVPGCESKLTTLAQTTLQRCLGVGSPGTSGFQSCVKTAVRTAAAKLRVA